MKEKENLPQLPFPSHLVVEEAIMKSLTRFAIVTSMLCLLGSSAPRLAVATTRAVWSGSGENSDIFNPGNWSWLEGPTAQGYAYGISQFPTTLLIDKDGTLVKRFDASPPDAEKELARILNVEAELFAWRKPFEDVYHLPKGTVLKRIKPPFIPERKLYYRQEHRLQARMAPPPDLMSFPWNGKLGRPGMGWGPTACFLRSLLVQPFELTVDEFDGTPELFDLTLPGDWVFSADASREQLLDALAKIVQEDLGRAIWFELRQVERDVIVARGRYRFQPLSGTFDDRGVHVFGDKLDAASRSGGGSGTINEFLSRVGNRLQRRIVNETEGTENLTLSWFYHRSSRIRTMAAADREPAMDKALANLSQQTSLTLTKERRPADVWFVCAAGKEAAAAGRAPEPEAKWGEVVNGLRAAIEFMPEKDSYSIGERVGVRFHVQNVTDQTIRIAREVGHHPDPGRWVVEDADRQRVLCYPLAMWHGSGKVDRRVLKPGEKVVLDFAPLVLGKLPAKATEPASRMARIDKPGRYFLRYPIPFQEMEDGDWSGVLETGKREVEISGEEPRAVQTAAAARAEARARQLTSWHPSFKLQLEYHGTKDYPFEDPESGALYRPLEMNTGFTDIWPRINEEQAARIVDHLEAEGFLANADELLKYPKRRLDGPAYSLTVSGPNLVLHEVLGWDLKMLGRLEALRKVFDGDAAKVMDDLLGRLDPQRKRWEAAPAIVYRFFCKRQHCCHC